MTGIPVSPDELVAVDWLNALAIVLDRKTTPKQVINSTATADLLNGEFVVPAGALTNNRAMRLSAWGDLANSSGSAVAMPRFVLGYHAAVLFDTGALAASWVSQATRYAWTLDAQMLNIGGNLQSRMEWTSTNGAVGGASGNFVTGGGQNLSTNTLMRSLGVTGNAVDTVTAGSVTFTVQLPVASASVDVRLLGATLELV